uniref:Uncharacterized protein n=1 Tax=Acrobeloides nanus TaxID=290746 RepID=A0A914EGL3_9BILA
MLGVLVGALMVFLALVVATFLYFWHRRRAHRAPVVIAQPDAEGQEDGLVGDGPAIDEGVVDGIWTMFLALVLWAVNFYRGPANMLPF